MTSSECDGTTITSVLQTRFRVLPGEEYRLMYNFFPLVAGQVALPRLHVNMLRYPGTMDDLIYSMLPSHIFIRVSTLFKSLVQSMSDGKFQ